MSQPASAGQLRQWVEQLQEPATRRAARQRLVAARAAEPLLACLESTNESVVWAAVESLGEMRAVEAVGPLVDLLEKGCLVVDVCEALRRITGRDFGSDVARWRKWLQSSDQAARPQLDVAECVGRTAQLLGVEPGGSGDQRQFRLSLADGRSQTVTVYFRRKGGSEDDLVVIYSECGPADLKLYEAVLRKNLAIPAGAFAIRDIDGKPNFVMVDTMLAESVTPSVLARKIENIASRADMVEKVLAEEDRR